MGVITLSPLTYLLAFRRPEKMGGLRQLLVSCEVDGRKDAPAGRETEVGRKTGESLKVRGSARKCAEVRGKGGMRRKACG